MANTRRPRYGEDDGPVVRSPGTYTPRNERPGGFFSDTINKALGGPGSSSSDQQGTYVQKFYEGLAGAAAPLAETTNKPIGVPEDYLTVPYHGQGPYRVQPTLPRYMEGDEAYTIGNMQPAYLGRLQKALENEGLLDPDDYEPELANAATIDAFGKILELANIQGKTWESVLYGQVGSGIRRSGSGRGGGGGGGGRQPLTTQVSNRSTLRRMFREMTVQMTGTSQPDLDLDAMAAAYQQIERGYQQKAYAMAETGGELETPMSAEEYAEQKLETDYRAETGANNMIERTGNLLKQLANGGI